MESSIVNVKNTEFPALKESRDYLGSTKWDQLNNSRFRFIYLLQIFKHTTRKYKRLGDNEKTAWSKSVATLITIHNYIKTMIMSIKFVNFEMQTDITF